MNTQSTEKKKRNWFRTIRPIALALVLVTLLTYATFSWMKRDWTPTISEENVRIVSGSSLVFMFGDDELDNDIPLNQLAGMGDFVFKSVSNCTGKSEDFFALNYSPRGEYFDTFKHLSANQITDAELNESTALNKEMLLGKQYGYVELTFKVKAAAGENDYAKQIRLANASHISGSENADASVTARNNEAAKAMRVSITVPDDSDPKTATTKTIIYSPTGSHEGITNAFAEGEGYVAEGLSRYVFDEDDTATLRTECAPGVPLVATANDVDTLVTEGTNDFLFTLGKGLEETIIVRIWLEGEDEKCTDAQALDAELDILLKFEAVDIIG